MGGNNNTPQAPQQTQSYIQPDQNTMQFANNIKYLRGQGLFDTPQQRFARQHPILNTLTGAAQGFAQGFNKQPFYTSNQENQTAIQNNQNQGIMNAVTLPQQVRLMQAMYGMNSGNGQPQAPTNIPGVAPIAPVIQTPTVQPQATQGQTNAQQWSKTPAGNTYRVL